MQTDHGTRTSSVPVNLQNQRKKQLFLTNPYLSVPLSVPGHGLANVWFLHMNLEVTMQTDHGTRTSSVPVHFAKST